MDKYRLLLIIEESRRELINVFRIKKNLLDPEVLRKSAELDRVLNLLQKIS